MKEWLKKYLLYLLYIITFVIVTYLTLALIPMWDCGYCVADWSCRTFPFN